MHHQDDAAAMAFAVLRNRQYRFLAVSPDGVVVSNGSPTLAIDVSRPVSAAPKNAEPAPKKRRPYRRRPHPVHNALQKQLGYADIMRSMNPGETHTFPSIPGYLVKNEAMLLANAAHRYWGKGKFSVRSFPEGVKVTRK